MPPPYACRRRVASLSFLRTSLSEGISLANALSMGDRLMWLQTRRFMTSAALAMAGLTATSAGAVAQEPTRLSDEQVERLLERIEKAADKYRESLDDALDESRLDDSKREEEINKYVREFEDATDRLEKRFDDDKDAAEDVREVLTRAARIDGMMARFGLTDRAQSDWRLVRTDLDELARAYGVAWQWRVATAGLR
jgi:signal transduction histidine kinase